MKKVVAVLLLITTLLSCCGCVPISILGPLTEKLIGEQIIAEQQEILKVGFRKSTTETTAKNEGDIDFVMTLDELLSYENEFAAYRSGVIFDTLTEEEQIVFTALEYAMVHSYDHIFIDTQITGDTESAQRVVEYLSFESPFLAQNVVASAVRMVGYYDYQLFGKYPMTIPMRSLSICVQNFREDHWKKNMQAFEKAKEIFDSLNTGGSKQDLIERLYKYVATSIEYDSGKGQTRLKPYLYDAFITKKTNCDGFSNALALLLAMADVPNLEKVDTLGVVEGHTWNCFELDGKWYNCDATAGDWITDQAKTMGLGIYFGFPDYLQESEHDHFIRFPECTEALYITPTAEVESSKDAAFYEALSQGFKAHNKEWVMVVAKTYDHSACLRALTRLVNNYQTDIYYHVMELANGKTAVFLYNANIYD